MIQNVPYADRKHIDQLQTGKELLPMLPNGPIPAPIAIKSVTTGTAVAVDLAATASVVVISAEDYGCYFRFLTADDTAAVTSADGGNARGKVLPGTQRSEAPITGATKISVIGGSGTSRVTIEQRS
jgi:hypothetical protein